MKFINIENLKITRRVKHHSPMEMLYGSGKFFIRSLVQIKNKIENLVNTHLKFAELLCILFHFEKFILTFVLEEGAVRIVVVNTWYINVH